MADSPRERLLMDFNWHFHLGDAPDAGRIFNYPEVRDLAKTRLNEIGEGDKLIANLPDPVETNLGSNVSFVKPRFDDSRWASVDLPHDWAVELPFETNANVQHGFKPVGTNFPSNSIGWYRREFALPAADQGRRLWITFDGVYRDSVVWLNGHCLGRNPSGYTGSRFDISKVANYGSNNVLVVRADASRFEGWFYEGAGIYRHVWLEKASPLYVEPNGLFVWSVFSNNVPSAKTTIHVQANLINYQPTVADFTVRCQVLAPDGSEAGRFEMRTNMLDYSKQTIELSSVIGPSQSSIAKKIPALSGNPNSPPPPLVSSSAAKPSLALWSPETPNLYKLITTIESGGKIMDRVETEFGLRTIAFDADKGFLLNGKPYLIKGTCDHQDHAGVGAAMPDALQYFRVKKLKEMGSNAIRTSHNPPTPELLEACDRLGMLVMDENRRVDNTQLVMDDLKSLVMRDRNHPSVFIWSLGNEESNLQATNTAALEAAVKLITPMQELVHELDPTRPCTIAMNGGNWGIGLSTVIDVQGFNYGTRNIDKFRAQFPQKPTIGTETASTRSTRGIYVDDSANGYVAAYGENGVEKAWRWWPYYAAHPFTSGGFVWTGFDYRGEPTPYRWPCISSHFGLMDTCGFPKDLYYYYQAWWTDQPVLHLATGWARVDGGRTNLVRCFSNCKSVELFLNGKSLGAKSMVLNEYLDWVVPSGSGVLSAKGYNGKKVIAETKIERPGKPATIELRPDRTTITSDGQDLSIVDVAVVDAKGRVVPDAGNLIWFELKGFGKIIGVGNGDPSCHEADKANERNAFNGYAQVIVQAGRIDGTLELTASSPTLKLATVKIKSRMEKVPRPIVP